MLTKVVVMIEYQTSKVKHVMEQAGHLMGKACREAGHVMGIFKEAQCALNAGCSLD